VAAFEAEPASAPTGEQLTALCHPGAFATLALTTVIAGFELVVLMYAILVPEIRMAAVPPPRLPLPFAAKE
jgi:hypothetical protein